MTAEWVRRMQAGDLPALDMTGYLYPDGYRPLAPRSISVALTDGSVALVDEDDGPLVLGHVWTPFRSRPGQPVYARTSMHHRNVRMHRLILDAKDGELVDHRNGDTLDNRRANLRITDASGNAANLHARRSMTGLKGVGMRPNGRFRVAIHVRGRDYYLGTFDTADQAAEVYAAAAREYFGDFANTDAPAPRPEHRDLAGRLGAASRDAGAQAEEPDARATTAPWCESELREAFGR